jgi:hypothetical protein
MGLGISKSIKSKDVVEGEETYKSLGYMGFQQGEGHDREAN